MIVNLEQWEAKLLLEVLGKCKAQRNTPGWALWQKIERAAQTDEQHDAYLERASDEELAALGFERFSA